MSAEAPPPGDNNGAPFKMSFGAGAIKGKGKTLLTRPAAPLVKPTGAFGAPSTEAPTERHVDELIRGLDGNKIESLAPQEEAKQLVIPKLENADWRQQALSKRKRGYLPEGSSNSKDSAVTMETEEADETRIGLQISKRVKVEQQTTTDQGSSSSMDVDSDTTKTTTTTTTTTTTVVTEETIEEMAARKILEAATGESGESARRLILLGQENVHQDEVEAFQKNLEELPDEASLEDYAKVPVEEFGAALLRGMGWKGDNNGSEAVEYNRRPALLGLGAKPREPEPSKKKYIKPGESRTPQSIPVPSRNSTARPSSSSSHRDSRDTRDAKGRDDRDSKDTRDRDDRDSRENSRSTRDDRDHRDRRSRDDHDSRGGGSYRDHRDKEREKEKDRGDRDTRDTRDSRDSRRDDRDRDRDRDYRREDKREDRREDRRDNRGEERRRDRSRDRERDRERSRR
ncbi:MAG: DExH-box splicing factor binding site-domain-containing protein [Linnemannia gamsii]|nr:MAG: DExH-box splicing factor binding site-domain-containing protein [Linnemannia gamsii]